MWWSEDTTKLTACIWVPSGGSDIASNYLLDLVMVWSGVLYPSTWGFCCCQNSSEHYVKFKFINLKYNFWISQTISDFRNF